MDFLIAVIIIIVGTGITLAILFFRGGTGKKMPTCVKYNIVCEHASSIEGYCQKPDEANCVMMEKQVKNALDGFADKLSTFIDTAQLVADETVKGRTSKYGTIGPLILQVIKYNPGITFSEINQKMLETGRPSKNLSSYLSYLLGKKVIRYEAGFMVGSRLKTVNRYYINGGNEK